MSIPSWAVKGAKCVCVVQMFHYADCQRKWVPNLPALNGVYTIRKVLDTHSGVGLLLEEVTNPIGHSGWETGFEIQKFRPVRTVDADIAEHFAGHLHQRVPEKA